MTSPRISLNEAIRILVSGDKLEWQQHSGHNSGDITLDKAEGRRLFEYLKSCKSDEVEGPSDDIFQGLINAWQEEGDPAETTLSPSSQSLVADSWKLDEIVTYGFGGLNQFGGPVFKIKINQETWCIEGQNGSGKTSLTSAIIWVLTGQVVREHSGLVQNNGERKPVFSNNGTTIGTWPPIAAYPTDENDFTKTAKVFVKLVFRNTNGKKASVYRRLRSESDGSVQPLVIFSESLKPHMNLIEAGVVMPNRLGHLGFGERSENLCDAVKMLTGLDILESIGQCVAKIKRGNSRFLNYAKQHDIGEIEAEYLKWLVVAKDHAEATGYNLEPVSQIDADELAENLEQLRANAETDASNKMGALVEDLDSGIDVRTQQGRDKVKQAVERIKADIIKKPTDLSSIFSALAVLSETQKNDGLAPIRSILESVESELQTALEWHKKQIEDPKLQLKAEASLWVDETTPTNCPLCEGKLVTSKQRALATELCQLKANADAAKRELEDVCNAIATRITNAIPRLLQAKIPQLENPDIKEALLVNIRSSLVDAPSFAVVKGLKNLLETEIQSHWPTLPQPIVYEVEVPEQDEPTCVQKIRQQANKIRYILCIAEWWALNRTDYWEFWKKVIGQPIKGNELSFPDSVIGKRLEQINSSLSTAKPFDETAKALKNAIEKEAKWREINEHQKMRESIADAIGPLAQLVHFVNAETSRSIDSLSSRIGEVLKRIHLHERLGYKDTAFVKARKSTVNVHGTLNGGNFKIDATLVANTSWLRAILWAFIFSLREEIVSTLGFNPFPLIVMDDPQVTFDPKNERLWASEIVRLSNSSDTDVAQFFITTHETPFFKKLIEINQGYEGRHGRIVGVTDELGMPLIEDGTHIDRLWRKAAQSRDDQIARDYLKEIRIFLESTLRYLLQGAGSSVRNELLSGLIQHLKQRSDAGEVPFERTPIKKLANKLTGEATRIRTIQHSHHDNSLGFPDAEDIQQHFWKSMPKLLHEAFDLIAEFRAFQGDHRYFPTTDNVVALPVKQKDQIRHMRIVNTGIAAAARTDGRAGDGLVTLDELDDCPEISLNNHDVFRLVAQTLEPVVNAGDYLIVRNTLVIENRCLVVAGYDNRLLARRYSQPEDHPFTSVLTAQSIDPSGTADPILAPSKSVNAKMIVGTLFNRNGLIPNSPENHEVILVDDAADYRGFLENARLFEVQGQSAEPIALEGQYLITGQEVSTQQEMKRLDGMLVIAADNDGARYFKRARIVENGMVILESLNPDGFNPSIITSLDGSTDIQLTSLLPVTGVLFELP